MLMGNDVIAGRGHHTAPTHLVLVMVGVGRSSRRSNRCTCAGGPNIELPGRQSSQGTQECWWQSKEGRDQHKIGSPGKLLTCAHPGGTFPSSSLPQSPAGKTHGAAVATAFLQPTKHRRRCALQWWQHWRLAARWTDQRKG